MNQFPSKNYFTLPNEIFSLGLGAGEIAVYAYLRCLENPSTYQCWPSYATIGKAIGRTKNTVMQYVDALSEKGLISTEPTSVLTKSRIKKNGISLLELHINATNVHFNPDGEKITKDHWHVYTEEYGRKLAFPAKDIHSEKFEENTVRFLKKFHVVEPPEIRCQMEL